MGPEPGAGAPCAVCAPRQRRTAAGGQPAAADRSTAVADPPPAPAAHRAGGRPGVHLDRAVRTIRVIMARALLTVRGRPRKSDHQTSSGCRRPDTHPGTCRDAPGPGRTRLDPDPSRHQRRHQRRPGQRDRPACQRRLGPAPACCQDSGASGQDRAWAVDSARLGPGGWPHGGVHRRRHHAAAGRGRA